jgi:phosphatidylinositol 4-phosphatase
VKEKLDGFDYFIANVSSGFDHIQNITPRTCEFLNAQRGTIRVNCMDCLDRTNVVQSVLSRNIAHKQLWKMEIAGKPKGDPFEKFMTPLENAFREAWTDNADVISILYTGTPALKTDFTRTGKRTWKGAVQDGKNAI